MEIEAAFEGVDSTVKLSYSKVPDRVSHGGCASEPYKTRGEDAEVPPNILRFPCFVGNVHIDHVVNEGSCPSGPGGVVQRIG